MKNKRENQYKISRNNAGLTQEQASEALYISTRTLSDYENNQTRPPDDIVLAMTNLYRCPLLGWWHIKQSPLGNEILPDICQIPTTNGDMAFQAWSAQNALIPATNSLMELLSGKLQEVDIEESGKNIVTQFEQIIGMMVTITLYGKKIFSPKKQGIKKLGDRQIA